MLPMNKQQNTQANNYMYIVSNTVKYYTIQLFPCSGIKSKGKQKINNQKLAYIELELLIVTTSALGKRQSYSRIQ